MNAIRFGSLAGVAGFVGGVVTSLTSGVVPPPGFENGGVFIQFLLPNAWWVFPILGAIGGATAGHQMDS